MCSEYYITVLMSMFHLASPNTMPRSSESTLATLAATLMGPIPDGSKEEDLTLILSNWATVALSSFHTATLPRIDIAHFVWSLFLFTKSDIKTILIPIVIAFFSTHCCHVTNEYYLWSCRLCLGHSPHRIPHGLVCHIQLRGHGSSSFNSAYQIKV